MGFYDYLKETNPLYAKFTGNDARIDPTKGGYDTSVASYANTAANRATVQKEVDALLAKYQASQKTKPNPALIQNYGANFAPTAPPLNYTQINAQARAAAVKSQNPLYVKKLNLFLNEQKAKQAQQQTQTDTDIQNLLDVMNNQLQGNETSRTRVGEDTTQNLSDIATSADQFQTDQGAAAEANRAALGTDLATSGLTGGLARQAVAGQNKAQSTAEERQTAKFTQAKDQANLLKSRSLDDLLKSDDLAKTTKTKGEKQAKFDLNNYIRQLNYETTTGKISRQEDYQSRLLQEEQNQTSKLVRKFIDHIGNSGQKQAAYSAYGGLL